ncbi:unnamed protein product, partial [Callosobruchus maculatus]
LSAITLSNLLKGLYSKLSDFTTYRLYTPESLWNHILFYLSVTNILMFLLILNIGSILK